MIVTSLIAMLLHSQPVPIESIRKTDDESWAESFERIQQECSTDISPGGRVSGCNISLECNKRYEIHRTINVCTALTITGCGPGSWAASSIIDVAKQSTAIRVHPSGACPFHVYNTERSWGELTLSGVSLIMTGKESTAVPFYGIHAEGRMTLNSVWIRGFVHGVHVSADHNRPRPSNANAWRATNVSIDSSQHAGWWTQGGDANIGLALGLNAGSNCLNSTRWNDVYAPAVCSKTQSDKLCAQHLKCAGIIEGSFLGSTYIGISTASNKDRNTGVRYAGFIFRGSNNASTIINGYSEAWASIGVAPSFADQRVMIMGGMAEWSGPGFRVDMNQAFNFSALNDNNPANIVETRIGAGSEGSLLEFRAKADDNRRPWRLIYKTTGPYAGWFIEEHAGLNSGVGIVHAGSKSNVPYGSIWFPSNNRYIGPSNSRIRTGAGPTLPQLDESWPAGSMWISTSATTPGSVSEYRVVEIEGKKEWRPTSRIE